MKQGVTLEDVSEAAESLQSQGDNPTIDRIRDFLGGTGSNTTISKYLNAWRQQRIAIHGDKQSLVPPDPVQAAVHSVWQQMREQTDAEIEKIREDAFQKIEVAQIELADAIKNKDLINQQYTELQASYYAVSAEKEILVLDYKKLQEQFALLEERYKGLDERYIDMQGMSAQQLAQLKEGQQKEVVLLNDKLNQQAQHHQLFIDEMKSQHEDERQRQMLAFENQKVDIHNLDKKAKELESHLQDKVVYTTELESALKAVKRERDIIQSQLSQDEKRWQQFNNKVLVDNELVKKLYDMPAIESFVATLDSKLHESMRVKLNEFKKVVEVALKDRETVDE